jgi:hypothetical protein
VSVTCVNFALEFMCAKLFMCNVINNHMLNANKEILFNPRTME